MCRCMVWGRCGGIVRGTATPLFDLNCLRSNIRYMYRKEWKGPETDVLILDLLRCFTYFKRGYFMFLHNFDFTYYSFILLFLSIHSSGWSWKTSMARYLMYKPFSSPHLMQKVCLSRSMKEGIWGAKGGLWWPKYRH